jgi:tRNA (guanine-N7-)-methyltransferase
MTTDDGRRAYIRRRGRITRGQARALEALAGHYLLDAGAGLLDLDEVFGRRAPAGMEIGFGMGHGLLDWARVAPHWNLLGIEIYEPGIGAALLGLERDELTNVRLLQAPAELVLERQLTTVLDEVRIFFPDPWPKARHHKRRLIQPDFVRLLVDRMRPAALLWVATDWEDYAEGIRGVLDAEPGLVRESQPSVTTAAAAAAAADSVAGRPRTRFEARGIRLGHRLWDFRYRRNDPTTPSR